MAHAVDQPIESFHSMIVPTKLYKFLSLEDNKLPRPEVVKKIYEYVADKNLRSNENRRIIIPDKAIKELFNLEEGEKLDFKNFQKSVAKIYKDYLKERGEIPEEDRSFSSSGGSGGGSLYTDDELTSGRAAYKRGGKVKSATKSNTASRRGDGIAQRGKTKGRYL
jgi:hypothetical protein